MPTISTQISLQDLALWILKIGYGITNPNLSEIETVKKELNLIYFYEAQLAQKHRQKAALLLTS